MNAEQYQRLSVAFDDVVALTPAERRRVLDERFAGEVELRAMIEQLLEEHDRIDAPVATAAGLEAMERATLAGSDTGTRARGSMPALKGAYRLLRTIGEGGMGVVYEAEQDFPRRRVALKSIHPRLATPGMLRRFRNEVELLARLHHPGIAQVFEAGFADEKSASEAFFVMELVEGLPLHRFAKERALDVPARLHLILAVCDAVQHAHQRGVIHRDLKPGNILVTRPGQPKILDFGIARGVDEPAGETMHTRPGQVIGTPSYMSPEQLSGEPVDTRTDVYSLGVILYELLSGALPYDFTKVSVSEATRIMRERRPAPLGTLDRRFRGDIETIVMSAMHQDVARRYSSAAALAEDIRSVLANRPIRARQDSALYVLTKMAKRHREVVALGVLLLAAVVGFAVTASVLAARNGRLATEATNARDAARDETRRANDLSRTLAVELSHARVDRGRAEAVAGKLKLAEVTLWDECLASPDETHTRWGLWELYSRIPCRWSMRADAPISAATVGKNGEVVVTASGAGVLAAYSATDGTELARATALGASVATLSMTPDGARVFAGLADGRVAVADLNGVGGVSYLGGSHGGVIHAGGVRVAAISADGSRVAFGGADRRISVWDTGTLEEVASREAYPGAIRVIGLSRDGRRVASSSHVNSELWHEWTVGTSEPPVERSAGRATITRVEFLDDRTVALGIVDFEPGGPGFGVMLADLESGERRVVANSLIGSVTDVEPSADGSTLLYAAGMTAGVAPTSGARGARVLGQQEGVVLACGWSSDGDIVTATAAGEIRSFDPRAEPAVTRISGLSTWCFSSTWSASGVLALDAGGSGSPGIALHRAGAFEPIGRVPIGDATVHRTRALVALGTSNLILAGSIDGRIRLLDVDSMRVTRVMGEPSAEMYALAVHSALTTAISGHADGFLRAWNIERGELIRVLPRLERRIEGVAFSPDGGTIAASGLNNGVQLIDAKTLEPTRRLETSATAWNVAYSPDGRLLVVTTWTGTIDVFDLSNGEERTTLTGHQRLCPGLAFSPDSSMFATGAEDSAIRLWDARTLRPLISFDTNSAEVVSLSFDSSGRYLAASTAARTLLVFDLRAMDPFIEGNRAMHEARLKAAQAEP